MKITGIFTFKDGRKVVSGQSLWDDYLQHKIGDILVCGDKKWEVIGIDHFRQGCLGKPMIRHHGLILKPIGHEKMPKEEDELRHEDAD